MSYDRYQPMELYYNSGGAWHYNIYNPSGSVESAYHCHPPLTDSSTPNDAPHSPSDCQQTSSSSCSGTREEHSVKYSASLKVLNPTNKKQFTMFTLRNLTAEDINSPVSVKEAIFGQVGERVVSRKLDFPVGFYHKSAKLWLNNEQDVQDAFATLKQSGKLTFWCMGLGKKRDRSGYDSDQGSDSELEDSGEQRPAKTKKRKVTTSEEKVSRVNEIKSQLRQKHGSRYSNVQYALWAEMMVGGTHESTDEPPPVPMFGANRPRGRPSSGNPADALTEVAGKIASALSPDGSRQARTSVGNYSSPTKSVELRGKYIQQLKEMVNLHDIGALTDEEYEEQRSVVVSLMRKLTSK